MTHPNFEEMTRAELRAYLLSHPDDDEVFHAYMDKLKAEAIFIPGSKEDLQDTEHFAAALERVRLIKQSQVKQGQVKQGQNPKLET
ncbi:MAG: hypothetical protein MUF49_28025 [Oculatellaceae cyanobacterium Prado106]|jgi:hypothetical protein|nr:hypothetical protein [Oculatellaceae cyanobacterium Prado106]